MDMIQKEGFYNGLMHILLLRMAAHVTKQLDMPPGGEFRRAFEEVRNSARVIEATFIENQFHVIFSDLHGMIPAGKENTGLHRSSG